MTRLLIMISATWLALLAGCGEPVNTKQSARILAMGDSLLAWNRNSSNAIADEVETVLDRPVIDRSVVGAHIVYELPISGRLGMKIANQYRPGDWDWIILNGGGNDLWLGCGCARCDLRLARLISPDGTAGDIPEMVAHLRSTGARVVYLGYLRSPGFGSPIEHCRDEGNELDKRLAQMAARDPGVFFVPIDDLVPYGDTSYHDFDHIHPSVKGSIEIGKRVAKVIAAN